MRVSQIYKIHLDLIGVELLDPIFDPRIQGWILVLSPLIRNGRAKRYQIKHLPEAWTEAVAVQALNSCRTQVGSNMWNHSWRNELIIPTQQYLRHHITIIAIILDALLSSQVIEAKDSWMVSIERHFAVAVDHFVALLDKFKAHITAMFDNVVFLRHGDVAHQCQLDHNSVHLIFYCDQSAPKVHLRINCYWMFSPGSILSRLR